jgi:protein SCO1/2
MTRSYGPLETLSRFLMGGSFPAFVLCLMGFYELLLVAVLLIPSGTSSTAAFAEEFRIWCFGYDPATGRMEWGYVLAMLTPQMMLGGMIALLWWEPLRAVLLRPRALVLHAAPAALLVAAAAIGFVAMSDRSATDAELPFPAEALRTSYHAPKIALVNQANEPLELAALRGNVVLLTAIYASCPSTCLGIMAESRRAMSELTPAERADLRVVAVTMDPSHDSTEVLAELARTHRLEAPAYNLLTGPPELVERALDDMGVARDRNPNTGIIDHTNLFLLIDRDGRVAYRFGLGARQQQWLTSALRILLREPIEAG